MTNENQPPALGVRLRQTRQTQQTDDDSSELVLVVVCRLYLCANQVNARDDDDKIH